jgi:hypothetical protein
LEGDPVRCPECFHKNLRSELTGPAASARRLRELQGAGDAFVLATISFAAGAALWWFDGLLPLAAPVIGLGLLLYWHASATARRIGRGIDGWNAAWARYLTLTVALPGAPSAIWLLAAVAVWSWRVAYWKAAGIDFVDFLAALPIAGAILFIVRPLRRLRALQRQAFARLTRLLTGGRPPRV